METVVVITTDGLASNPKEFRFFHGDAPSVGNAGTVATDGATGDVDGASRREPGREIRNAGDRDGRRVEMSLLPLKKRALGGSSSYSSSPKKRRICDCVRAGSKDGGGGCEAPFPRHQEREPVCAAAAEGNALSAAEKRLNKGKWIATAETTSSVAPEPPQVKKNKLMHDGIRSGGARSNDVRLLHHAPPRKNTNAHDAEAAAAATTTTAETKTQSNHTDARTGALPPRDDAPSDAGAVLGEALRRRLAQLGATPPWFVHRKPLQKSDVCSNQNRLLVSCKRESLSGSPITRCFSPAEMRRVEDKDVGLLVTALDRRGEPHALTCKFLDSNGGYRFISGWGDFLRRNGLALDARGRWTRDVDVELWAFRSRALPRQPVLGADGKLVRGKDGKPVVQGVEVADHLHRDGSLGLLLLHKEHRRRRVVDDREEDEADGEGAPPLPVLAREKGTKQRDYKRDAAAARGEALAGAEGEQGEAGACATMTKAEMVTKIGESMSNAVIGMMMLRGAVLRERRENVERGCGA